MHFVPAGCTGQDGGEWRFWIGGLDGTGHEE